MSNQIDCRELECPAPLLKVKSYIESNSESSNFSVFVDNEAAKINVTKFLKHLKFDVRDSKDGNIFVINASKLTSDENVIPPSDEVICREFCNNRKIMVFITSETLGRGDESLGDMLMLNYLKTLKEIGRDLWRVVFVNSGVKLSAEIEESIAVLKQLEENGVLITSCGACLTFYHILDNLQVGEVTNMLDIVTQMKLADSVITI